MGGAHPTFWLRVSWVGWALPTRGFGLMGFDGWFFGGRCPPYGLAQD